MILAYQEIDVGAAIDTLSGSELPNLMAMSFVFISIAIMLGAAGWVIRAIRSPKQQEIADETPVDKWIDVLQSVAASAKALEAVHENQQQFAEILSSMIDSVKLGSKAAGDQHIDFLTAMQSVKTEVNQGLNEVVKATNTMTDQLTPLVNNLLDELSKDRPISSGDKQDISDSVIKGMSESIINLWQTNKLDFITAISGEITKALSDSTQEATAIKPDSSEPIKPEPKQTTITKEQKS